MNVSVSLNKILSLISIQHMLACKRDVKPNMMMMMMMTMFF